MHPDHDRVFRLLVLLRACWLGWCGAARMLAFRRYLFLSLCVGGVRVETDCFRNPSCNLTY